MTLTTNCNESMQKVHYIKKSPNINNFDINSCCRSLFEIPGLQSSPASVAARMPDRPVRSWSTYLKIKKSKLSKTATPKSSLCCKSIDIIFSSFFRF